MLIAQGFVYINLDKEMQDPVSMEFARARNTNLNEDLGKIDYVFSDKTGTLTSNEMQLREIAIKGVKYGSAEYRCDHCSIIMSSHQVTFLSRPKWAVCTQAVLGLRGHVHALIQSGTSFFGLYHMDADIAAATTG